MLVRLLVVVMGHRECGPGAGGRVCGGEGRILPALLLCQAGQDLYGEDGRGVDVRRYGEVWGGMGRIGPELHDLPLGQAGWPRAAGR